VYDITFRGWAGDPKARRTMREHFTDARANYTARFGLPGDICVCSEEASVALGPAIDGIEIRPRSDLMPLWFYVGTKPKIGGA
jgi:hypothetical protein